MAGLSASALPYGPVPEQLQYETVAVVGPQYCTPNPVPLTVTKEADRDLTVTDDKGVIVMQVKGVSFNIFSRCVVLDRAEKPILTLEKRIPSVHNTWEIFKGDNNKSPNLLCTLKNQKFIPFDNTDINVYLAGNTAEEVCDFRIKGSHPERRCAFYLGDSDILIAQMSQVMSEKHTFQVTVYPNVDYAFIMALAVILLVIHPEKDVKERKEAEEKDEMVIDVVEMFTKVVEMVTEVVGDS